MSAWSDRYLTLVTRVLLKVPKRTLVITAVIIAVAAIGVYLQTNSDAATPTLSYEAESGTLATPASLVTDASASGGSAVQFSGPVTALCDVTSGGYANWSDPATWGGAVPAANSVVTIPAGKKIRYDTDAPHLNGLTIPAGTELCIPERPAPAVLSSKYIAVMGRFTAGAENNRLKTPIRIILEGGINGTDVYTMTGQAATDIVNYNTKNGTVLTPSAGTNVMVAFSGGVIDLFGEKRGVTWVQLGAPSAAGATTLSLKEPVEWRPGDKIAIASANMNPLAYDEATITAVSLDKKQLTLAAPLTYRHAGTTSCLTAGSDQRCVDERSEVGLLTHNIKITGPDNTQTTRFGGHTMVVGTGSIMRADNIEMYDMGQEFVLGRYPFHFHVNGDASASFVRDVSTYHSLNRQLTIHGTNKLNVSGMVAHDGIGHSIMLENGFEEGNVFDHNLVMTTRLQRDPAKRLLFTDTMPSSFWITNGMNTFTNNSAAGSEGSGFWYDPTGFGSTDVIGANYADSRSYQTLDNNIAHSVVRPGGRDDFTNSHGGGTGFITQSPGTIGTRDGRGTAHNNTAWMNDTGVWIDGGFDFVDTHTANNRVGIAPSFGAVRGGIIYTVGTQNTVASEIDTVKQDFSALRFYHGAGDAYDIFLGGFNTPYNVYGNNDDAASASDFDNRVGKIRFFGPGYPTYSRNYRWMYCFNFDWCGTPDGGHWLIDTDGSTFGTGDPSTPSGQPHYIFNNGTLQRDTLDKTLYPRVLHNWDGPVLADLTRYRPLGSKDLGTMRIRLGVEGDEKNLTRDDGASLTAHLLTVQNGRDWYTLKPVDGTTAFSNFSFDWSASPPSLVKMVVPWASSTAPTVRDGYSCSGNPRPKASSLANLGAGGEWYFDSAAKKVYVWLESKGSAPPLGYGGYDQNGNNYWCIY